LKLSKNTSSNLPQFFASADCSERAFANTIVHIYIHKQKIRFIKPIPSPLKQNILKTRVEKLGGKPKLLASKQNDEQENHNCNSKVCRSQRIRFICDNEI
jgi:hypothetical protein